MASTPGVEATDQPEMQTHVNHLAAKAGSRDRAQAVADTYRHGLAAG